VVHLIKCENMAASSIEKKIQDRLDTFLKNTTPNGACKIWNGKARNGSGFYGRVCLTYPGYTAVQTTVSRAVYVLDQRAPNLLGAHHEEGEVSHRCNRPLCIEPTHLTLEKKPANDQRRTCHNLLKRCRGCHPPCIIKSTE
jgi:hypothetical protein